MLSELLTTKIPITSRDVLATLESLGRPRTRIEKWFRYRPVDCKDIVDQLLANYKHELSEGHVLGYFNIVVDALRYLALFDYVREVSPLKFVLIKQGKLALDEKV